MKSIAISTTGGDAPGMNAAIRAAIRTAVAENFKVIGFERGYAGILDNDYRILNARNVGGIIHLGGTILKTSRSEEMKTEKGISKASNVLKDNDVEGLVVIGGNGSFRGALEINKISGIPVIGIPATIDNDVAGTDTTIGFDTAVNTALEAIDKIRDTATSHQRIFVVEVMGRDRGFLALEVGIGAGAEVILLPEISYNLKEICSKLVESHGKGKKSGIVVMAEGAGDYVNITEKIKNDTKFELRPIRLGHVQRGGNPTAYSRLLACKMGAASIKFLLDGKTKEMAAIQRNNIVPIDLEYAVKADKRIDERIYHLALKLAV